MRLFRSLSFVVLSLTPCFLSAADTMHPIHTTTPPVIDGKLDDPVWQQAPFVNNFKTFIPDFGKTIPESTVVYMAYDRENLYFGFKCYDPHPELIKAEITNRDNIVRHDYVCLNIDSFNDQQSLYCLYVNPLGIQADSRFTSNSEDYSVDLVWYSAGRIDSEGYTVEVRIPAKSIRYSDKSPVEMSLVIERSIGRRAEHVSYPALDPQKGYQFLIQGGPIVYPDLEPYNLFEILPAVTYSNKSNAPQGELVRDLNKGELSLTTKYGITSNLILDGTYNPDFSQIEADAGQVDVNLRYGNFFPEKRPFFLEGSDFFTLAATGNARVVHTRAIVNPLISLKLSGKLSKKSTIAAIFATDELLDSQGRTTGEKAQFPIARLKFALGDDSYVGGIYTGRELSDHYNRVVGTDGFLRASSSSFFQYQALVSRTKVTASGAELDGHSLGLYYNFGTRNLDYAFGSSKLSSDFNSEAGHVTRTGVMTFSGLLRPKIYPESQLVRRIDFELSSAQTRDEASMLWETTNSLTVTSTFGATNARIRYFYSTESFLGQRFKTDGFLVSSGGQWTTKFNATLQFRKQNAIFFSATPYQGNSNTLTAAIIYQPWNQLEADLNLTYTNFFRESDGMRIYDYPIVRTKLVFQLNQYLFLRGITEYNKFRRSLLTDFLASFTYIPGTVVYVGYGSLYQRTKWENTVFVNADDFLETRRGLFIKMSYLWRM